jgi:hypothetical protein
MAITCPEAPTLFANSSVKKPIHSPGSITVIPSLGAINVNGFFDAYRRLALDGQCPLPWIFQNSQNNFYS